jgi:hypothetical protein
LSPTLPLGKVPVQYEPQLAGPAGQVIAEGMQVLLISTHASGW